jgi:hypothetical protein
MSKPINMIFGADIQAQIAYVEDTVFTLELRIASGEEDFIIMGDLRVLYQAEPGDATNANIIVRRISPGAPAGVLSAITKLIQQWEARIISRCLAAINDEEKLLEGGYF